MRRIVLSLLLSLSAAVAHAQFGVYGMFSAGKLSGFNTATSGTTNTAGSFWAQGGTIGLYDDFLKLGPLKLGGDVRGFVQSSSHAPYNNQLRGGLAGLRLALHLPAVPVKPYLQAEVGGASTNFGLNNSRTGYFVYQVQAGVDYTVFPHLDLRGEYGGGQVHSVLGSTSLPMHQLGIGAAVRF